MAKKWWASKDKKAGFVNIHCQNKEPQPNINGAYVTKTLIFMSPREMKQWGLDDPAFLKSGECVEIEPFEFKSVDASRASAQVK